MYKKLLVFFILALQISLSINNDYNHFLAIKSGYFSTRNIESIEIITYSSGLNNKQAEKLDKSDYYKIKSLISILDVRGNQILISDIEDESGWPRQMFRILLDNNKHIEVKTSLDCIIINNKYAYKANSFVLGMIGNLYTDLYDEYNEEE